MTKYARANFRYMSAMRVFFFARLSLGACIIMHLDLECCTKKEKKTRTSKQKIHTHTNVIKHVCKIP